MRDTMCAILLCHAVGTALALSSTGAAGEVHTQAPDSTSTTQIGPRGGTVNLPGVAEVAFPPGAFDSAVVVRVEASEPTDWELGMWALGVEPPRADHVVRVSTGTIRPNTPAQVTLYVPVTFAREQAAAGRVPVAYVSICQCTPDERIHDYVRIGSHFDEEKLTVSGPITPYEFDHYVRGKGILVSLIIGSMPRDVADHVRDAIVSPQGATVELPGFARATFPAGAFDELHIVSILNTRIHYEPGAFAAEHGYEPAAYEIRVVTGAARPARSIPVAIRVPDEYVASLPAGRIPTLFTRLLVEDEGKRVVVYRPLDTHFDAETGWASATLLAHAFDRHRSGMGIEAAIFIGAN